MEKIQNIQAFIAHCKQIQADGSLWQNGKLIKRKSFTYNHPLSFRFDTATRKDRFDAFLAWAESNLDTLKWNWEVRGDDTNRNTREHAYFTTNPPEDDNLVITTVFNLQPRNQIFTLSSQYRQNSGNRMLDNMDVVDAEHEPRARQSVYATF